MSDDDVRERLSFALRRLQELLNLAGGDLAGANGSDRQQLVQEFFFHLVGATEVLAQLVNEVRGIELDSEAVTVWKVSAKLPEGDAVKSNLEGLYERTRGLPVPKDPYDETGYIFRILNYRHQVTHRRRNPFNFTVPTRETRLMLDPRMEKPDPSKKTAQDELNHMFRLIKRRCMKVLELL